MKLKRNTARRTGLLAALDVGTSKVCCFIARLDGQNPPRILGIGHQGARGVRNGTIVDLEQAEQAILAAVHAAEKMANESIGKLVVNISGGYPASQTIGVEVAIAGHEIGDVDVTRVLQQGRAATPADDRHLLHRIPVGFGIDGAWGIRDPRGMYGHKLGANIHCVTAGSGAVRNLAAAVARCDLEIEALVVSPLASGLACLIEDEKELGVTVIDMGGGTTTIAVFFDGRPVFTDVVPIGGGHVTSDIARGLSTPLSEAERMKTLRGSALASAADEREMIDVPLIGEDPHLNPHQVPKSYLTSIIQPRLEETFEHVRARLADSGFDRVAGRRVVLTGGASQLQGLREMAQTMLDKQVRLGRPIGIHGLAEATAGPAFATAAGLLAYAAGEPLEPPVSAAETAGGRGLIGRLGSWLRQNF